MIKTYRGKVYIVGEMHEIISDFIITEKAIYNYAKSNFDMTEEEISDTIESGKKAINLVESGMNISDVTEILRGPEAKKEFDEYHKTHPNIMDDTLSEKPDWA